MSMRGSMRGVVLVGGWVLGLGLATAISWAGVNMVGDEVAPAGSGPLSQAEVQRRIHTADAGPSQPSSGSSAVPRSSPRPRPSSGVPPVPGTPSSGSARPGPAAQRLVVAQGGTVVFQCAGTRITARYSPASGYAGGQESYAGGTRIEVDFRNGTSRSKVEGSCQSGAPVTKVEESDNGGED